MEFIEQPGEALFRRTSFHSSKGPASIVEAANGAPRKPAFFAESYFNPSSIVRASPADPRGLGGGPVGRGAALRTGGRHFPTFQQVYDERFADGWYSNKARGMRKKAAEQAAPSSSVNAVPLPAPNRASQAWAMLIKRVYEIDPLECPKCSGAMKVVAFIEPRAPERSDGRGDVIEKILRHCGLWQALAAAWGQCRGLRLGRRWGRRHGVFRRSRGVDVRPRPGLGSSAAVFRRALGRDQRRLRRPV